MARRILSNKTLNGMKKYWAEKKSAAETARKFKVSALTARKYMSAWDLDNENKKPKQETSAAKKEHKFFNEENIALAKRKIIQGTILIEEGYAIIGRAAWEEIQCKK